MQAPSCSLRLDSACRCWSRYGETCIEVIASTVGGFFVSSTVRACFIKLTCSCSPHNTYPRALPWRHGCATVRSAGVANCYPSPDVLPQVPPTYLPDCWPSPPPSLPSLLYTLYLALDFDIESCPPTILSQNSNPSLHPPPCLVTTRK